MTDGNPVALRAIDPVELGRRIKTARIERRMTQSAMAAGVASIAYVSRIESGQRRPDIDVLEGLARNLGLSARELLSGDATPVRTRVQLELDYAELELATGAAAAARTRLAALGALPEEDLAQSVALLDALACEALGQDAVTPLQALADEEISSPTVRLRVDIALCRVLRETGHVQAAIGAGEAAMARQAASGLPASRESIQLALTVASAHQVAADYATALKISREALQVAEALSDDAALVSVYWTASTAESMAGNLVGALELADRALDHAGADADTLTRARLLANVGMFQMRTDPSRLDDALANLEASNALMEATSANESDKERNRLAIAQVHRLAGRFTEALGALDSLGADGTAINPHVRAEAALTRGQALHESGRPGAAEAFQEAVLSATALGVDRSVANLWYEIAATLESTGDSTGAADAYKRAAISAGAVPFAQMERSTTPR